MMRDYKADFPLLQTHLENSKPLVYLDSAATSQHPQCVIDAVKGFYETSNASPHRGAYTLSAEATALYEGARERVAQFINAESAEEIVFTKNATDALNLVALGYGEHHVGAGDEILLSVAEHHSNLLPWQALARRKGAKLVYLLPDKTGHISIEQVKEKISPRTKIVALAHISNVLGVVNPIAQVAALAHEAGAVLVVDAAQSVPHVRVDVQALGADFLAFSAHKMLGPLGIGVLYGKAEMLAKTQPVTLGGGIVEEVTQESVRLLPPPLCFEAGTPNVEGAVGLHAAIEYITEVGYDVIEEIERELVAYMYTKLSEIPGVELYGTAQNHGLLCFNVGGVHPHDVATVLDAAGVTIRAGHHCAQPLMQYLGLNACCRASVNLYNTKQDIDRLAEAVAGVRGWLGLGPA